MAYLGTDHGSLCTTLSSLPPSSPSHPLRKRSPAPTCQALPVGCESKGDDLKHPPQKSRQSAGED